MQFDLRGRWLRAVWPLLVLAITHQVRAESAEYEVIFDAVWSVDTHPEDFPRSAHFSGLVGATHDDRVSFWQTGALASPGIESMAETGGRSALTSEVNTAISDGFAHEVILGPSIGNPPRAVTHRFSVEDTHPLVTLVSMIAPSPDWFIGTSGFNLRPNGEWIAKAEYDLFAYDSGTDSGPSFTSANADTNPAEPVFRINGFPLENHPPLGTFKFLRIVPGDVDRSGVIDAGDIDRLSKAVRDGDTDSSLDLNEDGIVDAADRITWLESFAGTDLGDSNLDGMFDSGDFVAVFQAGEYQDEVSNNSTWSEGDWDGNGDFDSSDLVAALQTGTYGSSPAAVVPEPSSAGLLALGLILLSRCRSRR